MKRLDIAISVWALCFLAAAAYAAFPFTYQGRLYDDGSPAEGAYDLSVTLLSMNDPDDHEGMVSEVGHYYNVPVSNGYFTVQLDFTPHPPKTEADLFDGSDRWLRIAIWPSDSDDPNDYAVLLPLPKITAAPYAHTAHHLEIPAVLSSDTAEPLLTLKNEGDGAEVYFEGETGEIAYNYDAVINVTHDVTTHVGNSRFVTVNMNSTEAVTGDRSLNVGSKEMKTVGGNSDETIGATRTTLVGGQDNTTVVGSSTATVGTNQTVNIGGSWMTTAGANIQITAGNAISLLADNPVQLQEGVFVSNDENDLLKVDGAMTMGSMVDVPPATTGYGKVFVSNADGKLYYIDTSGVAHDLTALNAGPVSFSAKRDVAYTWASSSSFETIDFGSGTAIWDNTGNSFNGKTGMFFAPADGVYSFHGAIFFTGLSKGDLIAAAINAAGKRYRGDAKGAIAGDESVRADITVSLHGGDVVTLEGYVQSTSSVMVHGTSSTTEAFTCFNGARVD